MCGPTLIVVDCSAGRVRRWVRSTRFWSSGVYALVVRGRGVSPPLRLGVGCCCVGPSPDSNQGWTTIVTLAQENKSVLAILTLVRTHRQ